MEWRCFFNEILDVVLIDTDIISGVIVVQMEMVVTVMIDVTTVAEVEVHFLDGDNEWSFVFVELVETFNTCGL